MRVIARTAERHADLQKASYVQVSLHHSKRLVITLTNFSYNCPKGLAKTKEADPPRANKDRKISHPTTDPKPAGQFWMAILAEPLRM